jgi:CheY-like chemotaxis protein
MSRNASVPDSAPSGPRRVLVVDDNRDAAESLARLIRLRGHEAHVAWSGEDALAVAATAQPHLVLLDIGLPGKSGYEVARQLQKLRGLESAVLVALTGYGQEHDRQQAQEAGFHHHWTKPADLRLLEALLDSLAS